MEQSSSADLVDNRSLFSESGRLSDMTSKLQAILKRQKLFAKSKREWSLFAHDDMLCFRYQSPSSDLLTTAYTLSQLSNLPVSTHMAASAA